MVAGDDRADLSPLVSRIAYDEFPGHRGRRRHGSLVDAALHEHPGRCQAGLAGLRRDPALDADADRVLDPGVIEDDRGGLAAELKCRGCEIRSRCGQDLARGGAAAGEADLVDARVSDELGTGAAVAVHDVDHGRG
jgi:hypothetical protein